MSEARNWVQLALSTPAGGNEVVVSLGYIVTFFVVVLSSSDQLFCFFRTLTAPLYRRS